MASCALRSDWRYGLLSLAPGHAPVARYITIGHLGCGRAIGAVTWSYSSTYCLLFPSLIQQPQPSPSTHRSTTMASFFDLPAETLLELAKFLPASSCLALSRTCSTLHNTLTPSLYENVHVTSKPSQRQHPISTLELFYAKMLKSKRKRPWVKTFAVSWAGESLKERDQAMIALLIDILPKVVIFQFGHLAKVIPEDIQHSIQGMDSTSLDLPARRLQIHQSRYPVRDELAPLGLSSPTHLIWADTVSPPEYFADFVRPLHNIKTLRLRRIEYFLCDCLDSTALPRLKNVSASLRVAFRLLCGRRIRRLRTSLDYHYKHSGHRCPEFFRSVRVLSLRSDAWSLEAERAFIGDMENLEVLEIESMHPVDSCIVPYGTKLKFLRISSNLFITRDVIDQLFNDIPTLECIEYGDRSRDTGEVLALPSMHLIHSTFTSFVLPM
ncbi:F-box domain-containing protein [Pleurotus pulmonarius]